MIEKVFNNFAEYWSYARFFNTHQRDVLLSNLPVEQRQNLMKSYMDGGWEDLVMRNELDGMLDVIKEDIDVDLLQLRCQVILKDKSIEMNQAEWDYVQDVFGRYKPVHVHYIFGGMVVEKASDSTIVLVKER